MNLAQIRSAVPEIFHTQTNKKQSQTALKTKPYAVYCVRAAKKLLKTKKSIITEDPVRIPVREDGPVEEERSL